LQQAEGFSSTPATRVGQMVTRLEAKLSNETTQRTVTAGNQFTNDNGETIELQPRGQAVWCSLTSLCEKLSHLKELLDGFASTDDTDMNASPSFLHRAYSYAKSAGANPPIMVLTEVVARQTMSLYKDGSMDGAVSTLDMEIDAPCGMSLFVDQKGFANEAQAAVSMRLILALMSDFKKEDAKATADSFTKLQKVVKCNDLVCALDHMLTLISYELNSEVDVENAAAFFHTTNGKANQELRTMFSTGVGRQWLLDARNFSLQRAMDAGFLGSPSQCILRL